jgi:hypothetical protein
MTGLFEELSERVARDCSRRLEKADVIVEETSQELLPYSIRLQDV